MRESPAPVGGVFARALGVVVLLVGGITCAPAGQPPLMVAAASTVDALDAAAAGFAATGGTFLRISYGPTSTLARQLEAGAPAALFLAASNDWADRVEASLPVARRRTLVGNRLVVVGRTAAAGTGRPGELGAVLAAAERIAMADPEAVPAGIYGRQALEAAGLWAATASRLVPTVDVRAALALAVRDEVDAAIVYATDARAAGERVEVLAPVEPLLHEPIEYPLLLLEGAAPEAERFFDFLLTPEGRRHFVERGFVAPGDGSTEDVDRVGVDGSRAEPARRPGRGRGVAAARGGGRLAAGS